MTNILNKLLPNRLPMAISFAPILIATRVVTASGSDVVHATRVVPMKDVPRPVRIGNFIRAGNHERGDQYQSGCGESKNR